MTRPLRALTLAAGTALAAPAFAGGTISLEIEAQNAQDAQAIQTGLAVYQIVNDVKTDSHVSQNGIDNLATLGQHGSGNVGIVHQDGDDHDAALNQTGTGNSYGIFQFGEGASGDVDQVGSGEAGLLIQVGF